MRFRPCIDIHNGKVKQIVGSSLRDKNDEAKENYVASQDAAFYAGMYREMGLTGGHIILLNPVSSPFYEETKKQAIGALGVCPGLMQVGGGITAENAAEFINAGASHVIVTSYVFKDGGINYTNSSMYIPPVVQGFITSASSVSGGRSAEETYAGMQKRSGAAYAKKDLLPPGVCEHCHWEWNGTTWVCTICGSNVLDGCECDEHGYCRCPIDDGWQVWLFMATLVMGYGLLRKQSRRKYSF